MSDYTELKRLAEAATQGEWQVIETELPCRIGRPHVERRIFTAKDHPQLKAPYPVVNGSVALGTDETPVHHMVSMTAEDAAYIAAANPAAVLALIAENERNQRMVLSACMSMGAIGESLGLDMDSDGDEMLGMVAELKAERDQLRAEVAGLRTGYEAYEQVNAELKAENEALRKERDARHPFKPFHEPAIGYSDGCMVCGQWGGHFGLPCPKTRAASIALSMENQRITPVEPLRIPHPLDAAMGKGERS